MPRQKKYNEHVNDHQKQLIETFASQGYIIGIKEVADLEKALKQAKEFRPKKYISNTENMIRLIEEYVE